MVILLINHLSVIKNNDCYKAILERSRYSRKNIPFNLSLTLHHADKSKPRKLIFAQKMMIISDMLQG